MTTTERSTTSARKDEVHCRCGVDQGLSTRGSQSASVVVEGDMAIVLAPELVVRSIGWAATGIKAPIHRVYVKRNDEWRDSSRSICPGSCLSVGVAHVQIASTALIRRHKWTMAKRAPKPKKRGPKGGGSYILQFLVEHEHLDGLAFDAIKRIASAVAGELRLSCGVEVVNLSRHGNSVAGPVANSIREIPIWRKGHRVSSPLPIATISSVTRLNRLTCPRKTVSRLRRAPRSPGRQQPAMAQVE